MLDASRAPQRIGDLTLFFDHADERRRYVLADIPRLVTDPQPRLSLLLFRGIQGGGLLQFEAALAPTDAQLATVERTLAEVGRPPTLVRPDWRSGVVRLVGWLQASELAPISLSTGAPSLVGDPLAVVAARLDAAGAALADAALRGNALPTVMIFELETLGLSGPLGIEAEADLQAIHDRLTAEGALTTPYGRARVAKTWESFARDNLIRVRVVDESGDIEGRRAEAMRRIGEDLIARMFSPFPPPERPPQLSDETVAPLELSFRLTVRREELTATTRWSFLERRAVAIRHYAAASLIDLLGSRDPSDHIRFVDLTEDRREVAVRVEPELGALGLAAVEVDLREAASGPADRTVTLTDTTSEVRLGPGYTPESLRYRVRTRFDPTQTDAEDRQTPWMEATGGLVVVSARRLFPPRVFTVIAGRVEFDWLDHVELVVAAPGQPPRSLTLSSDRRSADAFFPAAASEALTVTAHWRGLPGEPTRSDPPREVPDDIFVLDSPFADSINVLVVSLPLPNVATTVAELRTRHDTFTHMKTVSWDAPDRAPRQVGLRRLAGSPRQYARRLIFVRDDGTIDQRPWTETDSPTWVIGSDLPVRVHTTEVVLVGGGLAARGSFALELVLEAGSHRAMEVLEGGRESVLLVLVAPETAPAPVLIARELLNSGQVREMRWRDPGPLIVLAPVPLEVA